MPLVANPIQPQMCRDPEQPGGKLCPGFILAPEPVHSQENVLRQLFRNRLIEHHPVQEVDYSVAVPLQQSGEASLVPLPDPQHQFSIPVQETLRCLTIVNPPIPGRLRRYGVHAVRVHLACSSRRRTWKLVYSALHYSVLRLRSINSRIASRGDRRPLRMESICCVIGRSTLNLRARSTAADVVSTPSAIMVMELTMSSSLRPLASSMPTLRFLLNSPVHVSTRSPKPASPDNVLGCPPRATASREISASPRVIKAASELFPSPSPWQIPAAMAITFFSAAPISTPAGSSLVYSLSVGP